MIASKRQYEILQKLQQDTSVSTQQLSALFEVSVSTIKRDLNFLEQQGKLKREYGGAVALDLLVEANEQPVLDKINEQREAKEMIAQKASELVNDQDLIFIDSGTTTLRLAELLLNKEVTIVTNNLLVNPTAQSRAKVLLLGGEIDPKNKVTLGSEVSEALSKFNFNHCFMSANGVSNETGQVMATLRTLMTIKQKVIQQSTHKWLLVDHSKFAIQAPYAYGQTTDFDEILTDQPQYTEKG